MAAVQRDPAVDAVPVTARLRDVGFWAEWAAAVGLVAIVLVFGVLDATFLSIGNIEALLVSAAMLVILAVGQSFVIASAGIDLSIASTMTFAAVVLGWAYASGWGTAMSCVAAVIAGAAVGCLNGLLVAKAKITDFVVTLGSLSAASAGALILSGGNPRDVESMFLLQFTTGSIGPIGYPVIAAAVIAVVAHVVWFRTRFGVHLLATGGNNEAARAMGINTARVKIAVYTMSGVLAGVAAILLVSRIGAAEPAANLNYLLNSVAAVVLGGVSLYGGKGTVLGPVLGALLLTSLVNGLTLLGVSQFYQPLAVGVIVVAAAFLARYQR
ncbi:MAG: ABC transporter permease [Streptosporangiales bacterium]|nr:ABC transporter permease [Streptosporangiales bacterium]